MNEVRRFMRYSLPGLVCASIATCILLISDDKKIIDYFVFICEKNLLGIVFGTFILSGSIGYIFANIYFALYWASENGIIAIDHRPVLVQTKNFIIIKDVNGNQIEHSRLTKRDAWTIITLYWYTQKARCKEIENLDPMIDRMVDIMHGLGATITGLVLFFSIWILFYLFPRQSSYSPAGYAASIIVWLVSICVAGFNFYRTQLAVEKMVNSALVAHIESRYESEHKKVAINYA